MFSQQPPPQQSLCKSQLDTLSSRCSWPYISSNAGLRPPRCGDSGFGGKKLEHSAFEPVTITSSSGLVSSGKLRQQWRIVCSQHATFTEKSPWRPPLCVQVLQAENCFCIDFDSQGNTVYWYLLFILKTSSRQHICFYQILQGKQYLSIESFIPCMQGVCQVLSDDLQYTPPGISR